MTAAAIEEPLPVFVGQHSRSSGGRTPSATANFAAYGAWSKVAVRSILRNPRYTGRMTWGRRSRKKVLLDPTDAALGYLTKQGWTDPSAWVWSAEESHEPLIDLDTWAAAQARWAAGKHRPVEHVRRATHPPDRVSGC